MTTALTKLFPPAPTAARVVLLPDAVFFTRAIPVPAGATPDEIAGQVELALETLSPFPPAQLYHGFYHVPGAERVLVFAAYRRRFTTEQTATWEHAELVVPTFAAALGGEAKPGTTMLVPSEAGLTAIYWDRSPVPARVAFRPIPPDATEADRRQIHDELVRAVPTNRIVELTTAPALDVGSGESEYIFTGEGFSATLPAADAATMDVRDKGELAALRRARSRDIIMWRTFVGLLVVLLLLALGELALTSGRVWLKTRQALANAQSPVVEKIMTAQNLTRRINELSTRRLLPFEMLSIVTEKKPDTVTFTRTSTIEMNGLSVEAYTNAPSAVSAYQSALTALPQVQRVDVRDQRARDNLMTFTIVVTFKPDALKPVTSP